MKKYFATPKKTLISIFCVIAILAALGGVTALAVDSTLIGQTAAQQAALADAGVDAAGAVRLRADLELEHGQFIYEVEFSAAGTEYEYRILGTTGEILGKSTEGGALPSGEGASGQPSGEASGEPSGENISGEIDMEQAKAIAVEHAGFEAGDVAFTKVKLENDDGLTVYEVEFLKNGMEYEYTIHAGTGLILEYDRDWDD